MTERYVIRAKYTEPGVTRWLETLTDGQKQELGRLDISRKETPIEVVKDWIEEHGGERWMWHLIWTNVEEAG